MAFLVKHIVATGRRVALSRSLQTSAPASSKWVFNASGYNKYGLLTDDLLNEMDEDVNEALRRLPQSIIDERNYRLLRATHLSMLKAYLPKEQWTKYEDNVHYLLPYLNEVIAEREEKEQWEATH